MEVENTATEDHEFSDELDVLYRFRSLRGEFGRSTAEDIILHNRMYWSSPLDFNDPLDCSPRLIFGRSDAARKRWVNSAIKNVKPEMPRGERQRLVRQMLSEGPESIARKQRDTFREFMADSAICCFTKTAENLLLWSHYGDSHLGICFVFDEIFDVLPNVFVGYDVTYSPDRPEVDVTSFGGNIGAFKNSVLTKADDWLYEQEKRMIGYKSQAGLKAFPARAFKGVIFGARTSDEDREFVISLLRKRGGEHSIWQARLSETEFRVEIEKYCES